MTRNEAIAKKMGWGISDYIEGGYDISDIGKNDAAGHWLAHLLIERMVLDGFRVKIWYTNDGVLADATSGEGDYFKWYVGSKREGWDNAFSPSVVGLFCTVYGIKGD